MKSLSRLLAFLAILLVALPPRASSAEAGLVAATILAVEPSEAPGEPEVTTAPGEPVVSAAPEQVDAPIEAVEPTETTKPEEAAEPMPEPLYVGRASQNITIRKEMSREAEGVGYVSKEERVYILGYEPGWLLVVDGDESGWVTGYVLRHTIMDVKPLIEDILPYGTTPAAYSCTLLRDTTLHEAPDGGSETIGLLAEGTKMAILSINEGWAEVIYRRQPGYFYMDCAANLTPVCEVSEAVSGDTLAAFVSFFSTDDKGLNPNRIINIERACEYIMIPLAPGQEFSFNEIAGPYRKTRGYLEAPSFVGGETVPSYGGGTCQVSSTLYNVLLPLADISILYRVAHGPGGAAYLPHGVDAACGNVNIDLRFRNDFPFPIYIEASSHYGVLYIALIKG